MKKEEMSSPLSDQLLNFCESELFPNVQNSEVASSSNCCSYEEQSSYSNNLDMNKFNCAIEKKEEIVTSPSRTNNDNNNALSIMFDPEGDIENDIEFGQDPNFSIPNFIHNQELFDINSLDDQHVKDNGTHQYPPDPVVPLMGPPLGHIYEDETLSSVPHYMRVANSSSPSCHLLDPTLANYSNMTMPVDSSAILAGGGGGLFFGAEFNPPVQEMEFQGESGRMFCPDALPRVFNCSNELQALSNESQHLVGAPLAPDINLEDNSWKAAKCSPEERREKILRYLKKRNERNFSKKIKYACRKTLADSRPRVRGRFAKNDEFGEAKPTISCGTLEDQDSKEDVKLNLIYHHDPNMITPPSGHENNGHIFTSNCHTSGSPYDICAPLYCTDGQLH